MNKILKSNLEAVKILNLLLNNAFSYIQSLAINDIMLLGLGEFLNRFIEKNIVMCKLKTKKILYDNLLGG